MPDLADRISRGAVAALDLAPFDDRFARLSRQVLAGGASRFARIVADDQPVHYVVPVGLPHDRIDYGALVLQDSRAGVVWRDAGGVDHHAVADLGGHDAHFSALTLGGEQWVRFDLDDLVFLVPPVSSPNLRGTLIQLLDARPGSAPTGAVPEPEREPAPVVVPDEPETEPEAEPEAEPVAAEEQDAQATQALTTDPDAQATQELTTDPDAQATQALPTHPEASAARASDTGASEWAPEDPDATRVSAAPSPDADATRVQAAPSEAEQETEIFRTEERQPGVSPLPAATRAPVTAQQTTREVTQPAPAAVPASGGMSLTLRGFLIGLAAALVGGGLALAVRLLGG